MSGIHLASCLFLARTKFSRWRLSRLPPPFFSIYSSTTRARLIVRSFVRSFIYPSIHPSIHPSSYLLVRARYFVESTNSLSYLYVYPYSYSRCECIVLLFSFSRFSWHEIAFSPFLSFSSQLTFIPKGTNADSRLPWERAITILHSCTWINSSLRFLDEGKSRSGQVFSKCDPRCEGFLSNLLVS